ncbi:hypothetical protein [Yersinia kristensenii]|uniref:hypothetical protein n=1 Tax=Yersinia kristensenii TaxID=28152 RepID=UPI001C60ABB1|nr:hypothetical protein [Yersinia kristensenii]MBW5811526.1 hypothetical protein [Yersinia kristensenii]MBW5828788.1 hypothetical protein [Yersinia kristensenii]
MNEIAITSERTQVRLSNKGHAILTQMKEDGYLAEMTDGYRLGIALALSMGTTPEELSVESRNFIAVSTLDPTGELAASIRTLVNLEGQGVYGYAERLADWGIKELQERFKGGFLDVASLMTSASEKVA